MTDRRRRRETALGAPLQVWAGVECSHLTIGGRTVDQLELTGHDRRPTDLDLIALLGASAVRYPVLWERVAPRGLANADWLQSDSRLERLRELGVRPIVGLLHHGQGPRGMSLRHPYFAEAFASYALAVARRYPWVTEYIPINEPLTTARFGGLYGWWSPYARSDAVFADLLLTQLRAIREAMRQIRTINSEAVLIVNEDVARTFSTPPLASEATFLNERRWLTWDLLFGRVTREHPMHHVLARTPRLVRALADLADNPCPPDILGVDHYVTSDRFLDHRVERYISERHDPLNPAFIDVEASRVRGVPGRSVARAIRDTWRRYRTPLALTEISLAGDARDQVAWWNEAWDAAITARQEGVDLRAVTAWATFGATDWHCLMRRPDNIYAPGVFDASVDPPQPRPVAHAISAAAAASIAAAVSARLASTGLAAPVYSGWWTSSDRFSLTVARGVAPANPESQASP
jgi:dTDP-4-dehydrorhamnose reductase